MARLLIRFQAEGSWEILYQKPDGWMQHVAELQMPSNAKPNELVKAAVRVARVEGFSVPSQPEVLIDPMPRQSYESTDLHLRKMDGTVVGIWTARTSKMVLKPPIVDDEEHIPDVCRSDAVDVFLEATVEFGLDLLVVRGSDAPQQFVASTFAKSG